MSNIIREDGWNVGGLKPLILCLEEFKFLHYEILNCTRGSYAGFGDTAKDLLDEIDRLNVRLEAVGMELEKQIDKEKTNEG